MMQCAKVLMHCSIPSLGLGHMMGLDVHDMENLGEVWVGYNGQPKSTHSSDVSLKRLAIPLEPALYIPLNRYLLHSRID